MAHNRKNTNVMMDGYDSKDEKMMKKMGHTMAEHRKMAKKKNKKK